MKSIAVAGFLIGMIFFWTMASYEPYQREQLSSNAAATGFVLYRNAVNNYATEKKAEGSIPQSELALPSGLSVPTWKNRIVWENGELRCYVYGPASAETISAALSLLHGSAAVGWNNKGQMVRNGASMALPSFISDKDLVSVIIVDRG